MTQEFQTGAMRGTPSERTQEAGAAGANFDEKSLAAGEPSGASADDGIGAWDEGREEDHERETALAEGAVSWDDTSRDESIGAVSADTLVAHIGDALHAPEGDAFLRAVMAALGDGNGTDIRIDDSREEAAIDVRGSGGIAPESAMEPLLRRFLRVLRDGTDEAEAFETLVKTVAAEELDEPDLGWAIPVLAALTARCIARYFLRGGGGRISRDDGHRLTRGAFDATRRLTGGQGWQAVDALPRIALALARHGVRHGASAARVAEALPRIAERVVREPGLVRRLARTRVSSAADPEFDPSWRRSLDHAPRLVLHGPVEITIFAR